MSLPIDTRVEEVRVGNRQQFIRNLKPNESLILVREPSNPKDPCPISVSDVEGNQLGYLPKHIAAGLPVAKYHVSVTECIRYEVPWLGQWFNGVHIRIQEETK